MLGHWKITHGDALMKSNTLQGHGRGNEVVKIEAIGIAVGRHSLAAQGRDFPAYRGAGRSINLDSAL